MTDPFSGFPPTAFAFLAGLRDHNDPDWFKPRKAIYEAEVLRPFRQLIVEVAERLQQEGIPLVGDPARAIFRIYRDVRFSSDKRLYKTHAGAVLTRTGRKGDPGLLYLHLEPGGSRLGAGFWHPEPPLLLRLRRAILDDPEGFVAMAAAMAKAGHTLGSDRKLTRPPRGFEAAKETPVGDYVCWSSFTAGAEVSDIEMQSPALVDRVLGFARTVLPLLEWGWQAADDEAPPPLPIPKGLRPPPPPDF